jgi:hypothetical protein
MGFQTLSRYRNVEEFESPGMDEVDQTLGVPVSDPAIYDSARP